MTDKQIIIDGINVSELTNDKLACMNRYEAARLFIKTIKLLVAKEQECERLKKTVMYKCPQCGEEYLSPIGASLYEENNNLKEEKAKYYQQTLDVEIQINELLQTIAEIKEIAEKRNYLDYNECLDDILQKIRECEVEIK